MGSVEEEEEEVALAPVLPDDDAGEGQAGDVEDSGCKHDGE